MNLTLAHLAIRIIDFEASRKRRSRGKTAMRSFVMLVLISVTLLGTSQFWLANGGSNGTNVSRIGIEVGGTQGKMNLQPSTVELSLKSIFDSITPDKNLNTNKLNEPYTAKKSNNGPEIGHLFKSGVNLNDNIPNLTLQLGGGYALQRAINIATYMVSGEHWQQVSKGRDELPAGYGGLLYRLNGIRITAGYKIKSGAIVSIRLSW